MGVELSLEVSLGFNALLNGSLNLCAGFFIHVLGHALKHVSGKISLHQTENSGNTHLVFVTLVGVDLVENGASQFGVCAGQLVHRDDEVSALEGAHGRFTFEVGFENRDDFGVSNVAESTDENLDLLAVLFLDGLVKLLGQVRDVFLNKGFVFLFVHGSIAVNGVTVVGGGAVDLAHAEQLTESEDGRAVQTRGFLNLLALGEFLQFKKENIV